MTRVALGVSYNGQAYNGWQSQPDGNTVQDHLEAALGRPVDLVTASGLKPRARQRVEQDLVRVA